MTSSLPEAGRLKCNPAQRRVEVYLLSKNGLPNREIARRLNCDEGTVRRDLKFLRTPASERPPLKEPRPKKVKIITPEQRLKQFFRAAKEWFPSEGLIRPDILFIGACTLAREYTVTAPTRSLIQQNCFCRRHLQG